VGIFYLWYSFLNVYGMRKIFLLALVTIGMIGSSFSQMAIPGEAFAQNPARFNGRKVTVKNVQILKSSQHSKSVVGPVVGGIGHAQVAPGPVNSPTAPNVTPCNPPRGFSKVDVFFRGAPEYKGCFFMFDNMKDELDRQMGLESAIDVQISFRGDSRTGYHVSFYRLGM